MNRVGKRLSFDLLFKSTINFDTVYYSQALIPNLLGSATGVLCTIPQDHKPNPSRHQIIISILVLMAFSLQLHTYKATFDEHDTFIMHPTRYENLAPVLPKGLLLTKLAIHNLAIGPPW